MVDQAPTNNKTTTGTEVECVTTNATAVEGDKAAAPVVAAVGSEETAPVDLNALAPAAGEEKPAEVCEVPGRQAASADELANAILVSKPAAGETKQYAAVADGQTYNFDFNYKDALVETEGKNVVIRFADGAVVVLEDFADKASATKLIVDNCEAEPMQFASLNNIAPAAGAAPAAAGPQANAVVGNTGAGFNEFNAGNLPGVNNPLGPLGPTALSYRLIDGLKPEFSLLPQVDGKPNGLVGVGDPLNLVDETGGGGAVGDFTTPRVTGGTIGFDYGPDGAGSVRIIDGPTSLTHRGEPITTTVSADGLTATGTTANGDVIFVFTIDPATSTYTFTLNSSLDHPIAGNPNEFLDLPFVIRVTDADGDFADGTATMRVFDDAPSAVTAAGNSGTVDETDGAALGASGNLTYSYGGDGAGNIKLVGGPAGLTSGGVPVVVAVTDGVVIGTANGVTVFTLTLNQATGAWSYQQLAPLDHADINNPNDVLNLGFTVRVTDYDGDFVDTPINVAVLDDGPSVDKGVNAVLDESNGMGSVSGSAPISFGQDGPGEVRLSNGPTGLTSHGQTVIVTVGPDGSSAVGKLGDGTVVFELTLNKATGAYTFTQFAPLDHPVAGDPNDALNLNFGFTVTDSEGDSAVGNIGVVVLDDGPTAGTAALGVADLGTTIMGTLPHDFGADGAGSIKLTGNLTGLTSNGQAVTVTVTDTGAVGKLADGTVVFTFTVSGSGYSFVQNADLDGNPVLNLGYTVTDFDGDTATGTISVASRIDGLPEAGVTAASVDETGGFDSVNGTLPFSFGPDGAGSVKLTTVPTGLTSGGQPVIVTVSADGQSATGKVGDVTVFTLTINGSTGAYTFTQFAQLDHPNTADHNDTLGLGFGFTVTDSDGDVANGGLNVTVYDDGPSAGSVSVNTPNGTGTAAGSVSGTLPYEYGADGAGNVKLIGVAGTFTVDGQAVTVNASSGTITGTLANGTPVFSLVFNGTGYTYTQYMNIDGNPKLDFSYQVTDKDGDTATGHLNVQSCHDGAPTASITAVTVDETGGFDSVAGNLAYNYGPDGAGSVVFSTVPTGLTSHGVPVVVTISADGHTVTGVAGGVTVFTATITNTATGAYTFTQLAALDHPDANNPDDALGMSFGFTVTDSNGDSANGNLVVTVKDDGPTASSNCTCDGNSTSNTTGTLVYSYGADGAGSVKLTGLTGSYTVNGQAVQITSTDTSVVGKLADGTTVFTLTLNGSSYAYTQSVSLDGSPELDFGFKVTDYDGDTATGELCVQTKTDGLPTASVTTAVVDETGGFDTVSGNLTYSYGPDGAGSVVFTSGPSGLTSHGVAVVVTISADGHTATGTAGGVTVFTATITNTATGAYTFTQLAALDHPNASNPNDTLNLGFGFKVTDVDGDSANGTLNVTVYDDGPSVGSATLSVDETNATDTVGAANDGIWATATSGTPLSATGNINISFGQDGKGSVQLTGGPTGLTHHGAAVAVTLVDGGAVGKLADGTLVFQLSLNKDGSYTFKQYASLDHADSSDHNDLLSLGFGVKVTDFDGDSVTGTLTINVRDDGPCASDECFCIDQAVVCAPGTNVLFSTTGALDFTYGDDGKGLVDLGKASGTITVGGQPVQFIYVANTTSEVILGKTASGQTVFSFTLKADGSYTYEQYAVVDTPQGGANLHFGYTVIDGDNDCDAGAINICFTGRPDGQPTADIVRISVDETGGFDRVSGNLPYSFGPDGAGSVTFTTTPTGLTSKGVPVVVTISADGLTATGVAGGVAVFTATITNSATGAYTFTQLAALDHPNAADHNDTLALGFGFKVTDADGDVANGALNVTVYDDGPSAGSASITGATIGSGAVTGTLPSSYGLDGAGSLKLTGGVTGLTSGGQPITVTVTDSGAVGKLASGVVVFTLTVTGSSYSYAQSASIDGNPTFGLGYTVKDADGDTAKGTITITATTQDGYPCVGVSENTVVDETGGFDSVSGNLNYQYGPDGAGAVKFTSGPTGLTSKGVAVVVTISADGLTATGKAGAIDVFKAVLNPATGKYTFTQLAQLDHPNAADPNDSLDLRFGFQVSDKDGDTADGFFKVKVYDDGPQAVGAPGVTVDETNAVDTVGSKTDGIWATPSSGTPLQATGKLTLSFGQDGAGSVQLSGGPTSLTHHGQAVTVSTSGNTATGKLADGTVIFTLAVANDGSYTFKQYGSLDHPDASNHDDVFSFGFAVKVTDYDGDTATTSLGITIKDDGPCAADEEFCINQCEFVDDCNPLTPLVTVNGKLDFTYGNDGAGELKVKGLQGNIFSDGHAITTTVTTALVNGLLVTTATGKLASGETIYTLTVNPDGSYAYKQYAGIDTCGCGGSESTLKFDYTVIDADKDCDAGQINICITGTYSENVAPSISVSVVHTSDGCNVVSDLTIAVTDPDSTMMSAANVHLFGQSGDLLQLSNGFSVINGNVMHGGVDTGIDFTRLSDGGFHLAGSGTVADYQGIMDSVILTANSNPLASRNISFDVTDDTGLSSPTAMVNFYPTPFEPGPTPLASLAEVDSDAGLINLGLRSAAVSTSTLSGDDATEINSLNTVNIKHDVSGEKLDISQVLEGNCQSYEDLSQYVKVETIEGNTVVSVDSTGTGSHFAEVAVFTGVTGCTLDSMIADGSLEVGRFQS